MLLFLFLYSLNRIKQKKEHLFLSNCQTQVSENVQKDLTQQESKFLKGEKLKTEIKKYLESIEVYSFKELSYLLNYSSDKERDDLKTSLYTVFANAYSNEYPKKTIKQITQKTCVNQLLDLLESLNELWT